MRAIRDIRLKQYDYKGDGYYFVTAVCDRRSNHFKGKEIVVTNELKDLEAKTNGLKLDYFVVMPNHVHIIFILHQSDLLLGEIVRRFKAKVAYAFQQKIWQPNYYEHVIRTEKALERIREYIINNPQEYILEFGKFYM